MINYTINIMINVKQNINNILSILLNDIEVINNKYTIPKINWNKMTSEINYDKLLNDIEVNGNKYIIPKIDCSKMASEIDHYNKVNNTSNIIYN